MNKQITVSDVLRGVVDNMQGGAEAFRSGGVVADQYTAFLHQVDYERFREQETEIQVQARQALDKALNGLNKKNRWQARMAFWSDGSGTPQYRHRGERWMLVLREATEAGRHVPPGGLLVESRFQVEQEVGVREKIVTTLKSGGLENTSVAYSERTSSRPPVAPRAPLPGSADASEWAPKLEGESKPAPVIPPTAPLPPDPTPAKPVSPEEVRRNIVEALRMVGERVEDEPTPDSEARQKSAAPSYTHHQVLAPTPAQGPTVPVDVQPDAEVEPDDAEPDEYDPLHPDRKKRKQSRPAPIPVAKVAYRNDQDEHLMYMRKPEITVGSGAETPVDVPLGKKRGVGSDHLHLRHNPVTQRIEASCPTSRHIIFKGAEEYAGQGPTTVTTEDGWVSLPEKALVFVGEAAPIMVEVLKVEF